MELREYAFSVVTTTSLENKLAAAPRGLEDTASGEPLDVEQPGRPPELAMRPGREARVPRVGSLSDPRQRARVLHAFANHELQAVELFAWALLRFPRAPSAFRRGLLRVLRDEQRHARLYVERLAELGVRFGDLPVSGYFWNKRADYATPARFVASMCLTFENANLDHTLDAAAVLRRAGDERTAAIVDVVHRDELRHVRFGLRWLPRLAPEHESLVDAYRANVTFPVRAALARGAHFHRAAREHVGLDEAFIEMIATADRRER